MRKKKRWREKQNVNRIGTTTWSNPESKILYESRWGGNKKLLEQYLNGHQCGGCAFHAPFNADWGLCCYGESPHYLETVFEHFTCYAYVYEGWGPHSFNEDNKFHCRCGGDGVDNE